MLLLQLICVLSNDKKKIVVKSVTVYEIGFLKQKKKHCTIMENVHIFILHHCNPDYKIAWD